MVSAHTKEEEAVARALYEFGSTRTSDAEWALFMAHHKTGSGRWPGEPHRHSASDALFDKARVVIHAYQSARKEAGL